MPARVDKLSYKDKLSAYKESSLNVHSSIFSLIWYKCRASEADCQGRNTQCCPHPVSGPLQRQPPPHFSCYVSEVLFFEVSWNSWCSTSPPILYAIADVSFLAAIITTSMPISLWIGDCLLLFRRNLPDKVWQAHYRLYAGSLYPWKHCMVFLYGEDQCIIAQEFQLVWAPSVVATFPCLSLHRNM